MRVRSFPAKRRVGRLLSKDSALARTRAKTCGSFAPARSRFANREQVSRIHPRKRVRVEALLSSPSRITKEGADWRQIYSPAANAEESSLERVRPPSVLVQMLKDMVPLAQFRSPTFRQADCCPAAGRGFPCRFADLADSLKATRLSTDEKFRRFFLLIAGGANFSHISSILASRQSFRNRAEPISGTRIESNFISSARETK